MPKFTIYAKRSTIQEYEIEAATAEEAEALARKHLSTTYYLSDATTGEDGEEVESPFEQVGYGDDSEEEFMSAEQIDDCNDRHGDGQQTCAECE